MKTKCFDATTVCGLNESFNLGLLKADLKERFDLSSTFVWMFLMERCFCDPLRAPIR